MAISALYDFTEALSFDNTLVEVHLKKGLVHYELGEWNNAYLSLDKAVWFSRGENADALHWRTVVYQKLHPAEAPEQYRKI